MVKILSGKGLGKKMGVQLERTNFGMPTRRPMKTYDRALARRAWSGAEQPD